MNNRFWNWVRDETSGERTLYLNGVITETTWWGDEVTPQLFKDELHAGKGDVTVWMPSKIRHLLRQKILHEALASTSASGTNTFSESITIRGRIAETEDLMTDEKGRHIVCSTRLYTEADVKQGDRLTYKGNTRIAGKGVLRLNRVGKLDHLEVYLE